MKLNGWIWTSILGLLVIIFQILMPDLVPDAILKLLSQDTSQFIGLNPVLQAFLIIWIIGGYVLLITGIVGAVISHKRP